MTRTPGAASGPGLSQTELEAAMLVPEQYRSRARSVATLLATAAGALLTGLALQVTSSLPEYSRWVALGASTLLLAGTAFFISASLRVGKEQYEEERILEQIGTLIEEINTRVKIGSGLAISATVLLIGSVAASFLAKPDDPVMVQLSDAGLRKAKDLCPALVPSFEALRVDSIAGADPLVTIHLAPNECRANAPETELIVARADLAAMSQLG